MEHRFARRRRLSRRDLLARTAGLAAAATVPGWLLGCGGSGGGGVSVPSPHPPRTALVIGAGAAGLQCAHTLLAAGVDVQILEATNRRHGRVRASSDVATIPVEMGAEVIRGNNSSLYDLAVANGAQFVTTSTVDRLHTGGILPTMDSLYGDADFAAAKAFVDSVGAYAGPPVSIAQRILDTGQAPRTWRWLDGVLGNAHGTTNARLDAQALALADAAWTAGGGSYLLRNPTLSDLLDAAFADVLDRIHYGIPIRHVDATALQPVAMTASYSTAAADVIVVTVPLSILKRGDLDFTPALPPSKQQAIATIGMDAGLKAVIRFNTRFWPADVGSIYGGTAAAQYWATGVGRGVPDDMLTALVMGDDARALSSSGSPISGLLADLDGIFGSGVATGAYAYGEVVDWTLERWTLGAYSYASAGSDAMRSVLAEPFAGRVFFAGEATNTGGHFGTLHGALETGLRAANEALAVDVGA